MEDKTVERLLYELEASTSFINNLSSLSLTRGGLNKLSNSTRDLEKEFQYPTESELHAEYFKKEYERNSIATRVVEVMPMECWQTFPQVYEVEDNEVQTDFEVAWKNLGMSLFGTASLYKQSEGNPIWEYMRRIDILSGIGHYGVIFLGLDDKKELYQPADPKSNQKLLFLRCFDETCAEITQYETDPNHERFGRPKMYQLTFSSHTVGDSLGAVEITRTVHWTRVVHFADNIGSNEVIGCPRQRPVANNLYNCYKLYGASPEMYYRGAFPGLTIESHPHLGASVQIDETKLKSAIENYQNSMQRYMTLVGMAAKDHAPQVVDPTPMINVQIEAICILLGIPKRIFMGSERGELSSSQDQGTWNKRVLSRQSTYITPRMIIPFINHLIWLKVLPTPKEYFVDWPELDAQTEDEKASTAIKKIHALTKYVAGDVETIMSPLDFFVYIYGLTIEEANTILQNAIDSYEDSEQRNLALDIIKAKALKEYRIPTVTDEEKQALMDFGNTEEEEDTERDAISDKHTNGAEGKKGIYKLTSSKVDSPLEDLDTDEDKDLI